jgi:hypothetical protein
VFIRPSKLLILENVQKMTMKVSTGKIYPENTGRLSIHCTYIVLHEANINSVQIGSACKESALTTYRKALGASNLSSWQPLSGSTFIELTVLYNVHKIPQLTT